MCPKESKDHKQPLWLQWPRPSQNGQWTDNATTILKKRNYLLRNENGQVIESPEDMCWRVAVETALAEKNYGAEDEEVRQVATNIYRLMVEGKLIFNTPTLTNSGKGRQLSKAACTAFVVNDDMGHIFEMLRTMALVQQAGGGTGFSFSELRPKGDRVSSTGGESSGPVEFIKVFNRATEAVKQGGIRRGASLACLAADHPDIYEFIQSKLDGDLTNFNISVMAKDAFMRKAIGEDPDPYYPLINPRNKEVWGQANAQEVFDAICQAAWTTGDPGLLFYDAINRDNPTSHVGSIETTNPCVTGDTWVWVADGLRQVKDLLKKPFTIITPEGEAQEVLPFFPTGKKAVYRVTTTRGYEITTTADHLIKTDCGWLPVEKLTPGTAVALGTITTDPAFALIDTEFREGQLLGWLLGDGSFNDTDAILSFWDENQQIAHGLAAQLGVTPVAIKERNEIRIKSHKVTKLAAKYGITNTLTKTITDEILRSSLSVQTGLLSALFAADGCAQIADKGKFSIRLTQSDLVFLKRVQLMLSRFGIISTIYSRRPEEEKLLPNGKGDHNLYATKPQFELVLCSQWANKFLTTIGFADDRKQTTATQYVASLSRGLYSDKTFAEVKYVEYVGEEDVYDVQVPGANAFVAGGIVVHNCGEQPLLHGEACNLGALNVAKYWDPETKTIAEEKLRADAAFAIRALDNVIDVSSYPTLEMDKIVRANRKVGLGILGLADLLIAAELPYNSEEGRQFAARVMSIVQAGAHSGSQELAQSRGTFPNWKGSAWEQKGIAVRNATTTTVAPNGTTGIIIGATGGIEPIFAVAFTRRTADGQILRFIHPLFIEVAKREGFYSEELLEQIAQVGTVQGIDGVPKKWQSIFAAAHDIHWEDHIKMQAVLQQHVDNAISKTVNLPHNASIADVKAAYTLAWKLGCKGITIFRDGSKQGVLTTGTSAQDSDNEQTTNKYLPLLEEDLQNPATLLKLQKLLRKKGYVLAEWGNVRPMDLPQQLPARWFEQETPVGKAQIFITELDGRPVQLFIQVGHGGSDIQADCEAIGRLTSGLLRAGVPLHWVTKQLKGIGGDRQLGFGPDRVRSLADAIGKILYDEYISNGKVRAEYAAAGELRTQQEPFSGPSFELCPACGNYTLMRAEGCGRCICGYSEC
ncbi:MAG: ribonucleotide reductase N-terminal alpha domain-containing protein [bacterium]|jgi:ribonucleoside-diphosphate reductase alpha chain